MTVEPLFQEYDNIYPKSNIYFNYKLIKVL